MTEFPLRKISVGLDPKNSMHYVVDNTMGKFIIHTISKLDDGRIRIFVSVIGRDPDTIYPWKTFNPNTTPITEEHYIEIE